MWNSHNVGRKEVEELLNTDRNLVYILVYEVGRVAQSVWRLATVWTVRGSNPDGARFFAHVQTGPGAHPASCTMGTGVKRPGRGADHPPPSSAEVKNE
jgi:hypothetical protein